MPPVSAIPDGPGWTFEIKLDGYRLEAGQTGSRPVLWSRRGHVFNDRFPEAAAALNGLASGTLIAGEVVALD